MSYLSLVFYPFRFLFATFMLSTATAVTICTVSNIPFINPKWSTDIIKTQYTNILTNATIIVAETTLFYNYNTLLPNATHNFFWTLTYFIIYSVFIEFNYYIYHYTVHHKYLYSLIHKKHHKNVELYPFDTYYLEPYDVVFLLLCLQIPHIFIQFTELEMFLVNYVYFTGNYLAHSNVWIKHHATHHKHPYSNYCLLLPVFDILLGSYKK